MSKRRPVRQTSPAMRRVLFAFELHGPLDGREVEALAYVSFNYFQNQCRHVLEKAQAIHLVGYYELQKANRRLANPKRADPVLAALTSTERKAA